MQVVIIIVAGFHYIALGIGLGAVFMRGRYLRTLAREPSAIERLSKPLFVSDNLWGVAALLWIVTGLLRAFAGLEKGTGYYLHNPMFHLKMGMFLLVFVLEVPVMMALIRWRQALKRGETIASLGRAKKMAHANHFEIILLTLIPFVAAAMARGIGMAH